MSEERLQDLKEEDRKDISEITSGQYLWRTLKPAGCIFVLILMAAMLIFCFTSGRDDPLKGYDSLHDTAFYAENPEALLSELQENAFPLLEGIESAEVKGGIVSIEIAEGSYIATRSAILKHFDKSLFEFPR